MLQFGLEFRLSSQFFFQERSEWRNKIKKKLSKHRNICSYVRCNVFIHSSRLNSFIPLSTKFNPRLRIKFLNFKTIIRSSSGIKAVAGFDWIQMKKFHNTRQKTGRIVQHKMQFSNRSKHMQQFFVIYPPHLSLTRFCFHFSVRLSRNIQHLLDLLWPCSLTMNANWWNLISFLWQKFFSFYIFWFWSSPASLLALSILLLTWKLRFAKFMMVSLRMLRGRWSKYRWGMFVNYEKHFWGFLQFSWSSIVKSLTQFRIHQLSVRVVIDELPNQFSTENARKNFFCCLISQNAA